MATNPTGLVILHTGSGKGKTTASLGLAFRTLGHGKKVLMRQFIKGSWTPGEVKAAARFEAQFDWQALGEGFLTDKSEAGRARAREQIAPLFATVREEVLTGDADLVILDELLYVLHYGLIDEAALLDLIAEKRRERPHQHLVLTGRGATEKVIAAADLVTEMTLVKHPYQAGIPAQPCIEY